MSIITISRQVGSLGDEVAEALSSKLDWELITRNQLIDRFFADKANDKQKHLLNESAKFYLSEIEGYGTYKDLLEQSLYTLAGNSSAILVGFGSQVIFAGNPDAVHVRIIAPEKTRITRIRKKYSVSESEAGQILAMADTKHKRFVSTVFGEDITNSSLYHITLNTSKLGVDECAAAIIALQREHELRCRLLKENEKMDTLDHQTDLPVFKNPSEAEFARILDMYQIAWKYEPKTFPGRMGCRGQYHACIQP